MEQVAQYLGLGWVGSLLGIAGIALSIWFYIKSVRKPSPIAAFESIRLVGAVQSVLPETVTVQFRDRRVPRVNRSIVRIWNGGNLTLEGGSVSAVEPIRLQIEPGAEFLSVVVTKLTREVTQLSAGISEHAPHQAIIDFDFLDPADGAVIECLHTGEQASPEVKGVIKGLPKGVTVKDIDGYTRTREKRKRIYQNTVIGVIMIVAGLGVIWGAFFPLQFWTSGEFASKTTKLYTGLFTGIIYTLGGILILSRGRRPFPKALSVSPEKARPV